MLKIGITGGIGTGKTTICKIFELLGVPIFYADQAAKELYNTHGDLMTKMIEYFGESIYIKSNLSPHATLLDRSKLKKIIFENPEKLEFVNSMVHPMIKIETAKWFTMQSFPYAIQEAALIIETKSYKDLDALILVEAPMQLRLQRVSLRDHLNTNEIVSRINAQMPENEKKKFASHTIKNDEVELLIPQVLNLHKYFLKKAKEK